ncbi:tryptophan-rich sensory protein [Tessaracoccus sp. MC1627]|uniref:tryptophan-rich sensory protein n=1 Tax=Tessaracoccus sp. MC1627 TaxID=2760312 RepID=UPI00160439F8|nr:tryptophan-rich sensory protein [Tessaracoccus sp. MC1627]MBB1511321.1 tryptophan-rich sensory protein [Tessaracoccus sp. MC1627]
MLRNDRIRQVVITASAVFMIIGTLFGIGVIGTRVEESAGGSLSATATLVAPAVSAFSIWSVIYAGLIAYVVWQWLPANTTTARARSIGWLAAASMVLNASWLLVTQVGWLWASVAVIVALALVLGELVRRLTALPADADRPATTWAERFIVDGTFGLYLGWVSVATVANITATLVDSGVNPAAPVSEYLAVAVLAVAAALGVILAKAFGGRFGVAAAMAWGLGWIAVGRLTDAPASTLTGVAAAVAAAVIVAAAVAVRLRTSSSVESRAAHATA